MTRSSPVRGALLAATLLAVHCASADKEESQTEAAVPVTTAVARTGTLQGIVRATGIVGAAPGALQAVTSPGASRIVAMPKGVGDIVHKGDLLVRFDAPTLTADATAKAATVAQAEARLDNARKADERTAGLLERGIAARKDVEDAHRDLRDAEAGLAQATAERDAARTLAERAVVHAEFAGLVVDRSHNPGDFVDGGGEPLLRIVDPSRLQVDAAISAADLGRIRTGQGARVHRAAGDETPVSGRVAGVSASVNAATGMGTLRVGLPADTRLPVGLSVPLEVDAEQRANVTIVPSTAVVHEGPTAFVYVLGPDAKAQRREVALGIAGESDVEIRSGVATGEIVIVSGQQGLPDGAQVAVPK
jgi:RND family efflux transporter MFP subunit